MRWLFATLICAAGLLALAGAVRSTPSATLSCPHVGPHQGGTSGDLEVVFGLRRDMTSASALLARVKAKGFGCARIEHESGLLEICINGITRYSVAQRIMRRARRRHLRVTLEIS